MKTPLFLNTVASLKRVGTFMTITAALFFASCDNDDTPDPVNEEEVITTITATLTPVGGGATITLQSRDIDGDGPGAPVITVTGGDFAGNTTYNGTMEILNETESPAEDVTEEILEEDDEHQFFFEFTGSIAGVTYSDTDGDGNPLGQTFALTTGTAGAASLRIVLRHEPTKPNNGLADAGGETDFDVTFSNLLITN
jgi:hypothetical protein